MIALTSKKIIPIILESSYCIHYQLDIHIIIIEHRDKEHIIGQYL